MKLAVAPLHWFTIDAYKVRQQVLDVFNDCS
jgi:hypothetical protein